MPGVVGVSSRRELVKMFLYFFWFSGSLQLLLLITGKTSGVGFRNVLVYSLPWLIIPLWFHVHARRWMLVTGLLMSVCGLLGLGYFLMYGQELSQSIFYVIFDSNIQEGTEFFHSYLKPWMVPVMVLYLVIPACLWWKTSPVRVSGRQKASITALIALTILEPFVSHHGFAQGWSALVNRQASVAPWNMVINYTDYRENIQAVENTLANLGSIDVGVVRSLDPAAGQTYVLVIGESTNRQRMSLYGYSRNTSPELQSLSDELTVFNDVNAAIPYTIESITSALYFTDRSEISRTFDTQVNLIMLMKKLGFSVFWITNQQTITHRNTLLTTFSKMADKAWYLNNNRLQSARQLDEDVLVPFEEALQLPVLKKLIVVHLLGTHFSYRFRYPESFERFSGTLPTSVELSAGDQQTYNEYDNAVLYNDHVVASLIRSMKATNPYGALVYFSDHGEEVFDSVHFNGRNSLSPTPAMYTVPFLVWGSGAWSTHHQSATWQAWKDRPYSLDDFIHTWCDLVSLQYRECRAEKSLLNPAFVADLPARTHPWLASKAYAQQ